MSSKSVVLAFSGGLDTSFCVPWLIERGYDVTTVFVDTGGIADSELEAIEKRAITLGAVQHVVADAAKELWTGVVTPLLSAGEWYQGQYPLLCSDRYLVVQKALELCERQGTRNFAHGCTGVGNDQVRFDLAVRSLGDYDIIAPIRELQDEVEDLRQFELEYLTERGFEAPAKSSQYTINVNLLGATISGSEIDRWEAPGPETYQLTAHPEQWPGKPLELAVDFRKGVPIGLDGRETDGPSLLAELNRRLGAYGIGRGIYTGDTCVGLKGRIVYEAPGLTALAVAHRALEEVTSTRLQNEFKPMIGRKWVELVYFGFFFDPLKDDLDAYLEASQRKVNGTVTLEVRGGMVQPVAIDSEHILRRPGAVYAQRADWSTAEAQGFIKLFGQSSELWASINRPPK